MLALMFGIASVLGGIDVRPWARVCLWLMRASLAAAAVTFIAGFIKYLTKRAKK